MSKTHLRALLIGALALKLWSGWLDTASANTISALGNNPTDIFTRDIDTAQAFRLAIGRDIVNNDYSSMSALSQSAAMSEAMIEAGLVARSNADRISLGSTSNDLTGVVDSTTKLIATLAIHGPNRLYGLALSARGDISPITRRDSGRSPVALRPAILLLSSALAGLAVLSLRYAAQHFPGTNKA